MVCMPIGLGILAVAPEFVRIILGERWQGIALIMQVLSVMGIAKALEGTTNSLVMAVGRPGWLMGFSALQLCLLAASLYPLTARWGIHGAAIAVTSTALLAAAAALAAAVRITGSKGRRILTLLIVPMGASMSMAAGIILLKRLMGTVGLPGLLFLVAAGIGLYAAGLIVADAVLTSGRYRDLAAHLLASLRGSGKGAATPFPKGIDGVAAAVRSDDPLR